LGLTHEVNETVKDLKERGSIKDIKDITKAVSEITNETRNTIEIAKAAIDADNTK